MSSWGAYALFYPGLLRTVTVHPRHPTGLFKCVKRNPWLGQQVKSLQFVNGKGVYDQTVDLDGDLVPPMAMQEFSEYYWMEAQTEFFSRLKHLQVLVLLAISGGVPFSERFEGRRIPLAFTNTPKRLLINHSDDFIDLISVREAIWILGEYHWAPSHL